MKTLDTHRSEYIALLEERLEATEKKYEELKRDVKRYFELVENIKLGLWNYNSEFATLGNKLSKVGKK